MSFWTRGLGILIPAGQRRGLLSVCAA